MNHQKSQTDRIDAALDAIDNHFSASNQVTKPSAFQINPYTFDGNSIRALNINGEPFFVGKDIASVLGYANPQKAVRDHCKSPRPVGVTDSFTPAIDPQTILISEPDMLRLIVSSNMPAAERFERWVFEDVLPSIRRTGGYTTNKSQSPKNNSTEAFKLVPMVVRAARALGLDRNSAAISANQVVAKLTGTNVLQLLGHTHLQAEQQELVFTPSELGERLGGISGRKVNMLLAEAGLQAKKGEHWAPLAPAEGFFRVLDTGKRHGDGTMIQQIKWAENVLVLIKQAA